MQQGGLQWAMLWRQLFLIRTRESNAAVFGNRNHAVVFHQIQNLPVATADQNFSGPQTPGDRDGG